MVRVATWNIAGGHQSSQAPKTWSQRDQRAAVCAEVLRWRAAFQCDVVALQECEDGSAMGELGAEFELVGSAEAKDTRGHVHLYVRRGVEARCLDAGVGEPCVAAAVKVPGIEAEVCVVAVHLPSGDKAVARRGVLKRVVDRVVPDDGSLLVVGDCNAPASELESLREAVGLRSACYAGATWGVAWNKFYEDAGRGGSGHRYDQALFGAGVWAEAHVVAKGRQAFQGHEFCLSDHFGLMVYADVAAVYASRAKAAKRSADARRRGLVQLREQAQQREEEEVKARRQAAAEGRAVARQRASEQARGEWVKAQRSGARARASRREELRRTAFVRGRGALRAGAWAGRGDGGVVGACSGRRGGGRRCVGRCVGAAEGWAAESGGHVLRE